MFVASVKLVVVNVGVAPLTTDWSNALTSAILVSSLSINAPALVTLAVSVTSALASIAFNLVWSASVNTFESEALSTNALISLAVWSAVAEASIAFSLLWSASVNTLELVADSTNVLISLAVWSAVALASMPSNLLWSADSKGTEAVPLIVKASVSNVPSISTLPDISKLGATTSCENTKLSLAALQAIVASVEAFTAS